MWGLWPMRLFAYMPTVGKHHFGSISCYHWICYLLAWDEMMSWELRIGIWYLWHLELIGRSILIELLVLYPFVWVWFSQLIIFHSCMCINLIKIIKGNASIWKIVRVEIASSCCTFDSHILSYNVIVNVSSDDSHFVIVLVSSVFTKFIIFPINSYLLGNHELWWWL